MSDSATILDGQYLDTRPHHPRPHELDDVVPLLLARVGTFRVTTAADLTAGDAFIVLAEHGDDQWDETGTWPSTGFSYPTVERALEAHAALVVVLQKGQRCQPTKG